MEKTRRAERLVAFLRLIVVSGILGAMWNQLPRYPLYAIAGSVFVYNLLSILFLTGKRYERCGKFVSAVVRMLDIAFITAVLSYTGPVHSPVYLAYIFVLISSGFTTASSGTATLTMAAIFAAFAGSVGYSLYDSPVAMRFAGLLEVKGAVIAFGWLISAYIASARSSEQLVSSQKIRLQAFFDCGSQLTSMRSVQELAKHVLQCIIAETSAAGGELFLVDEELKELTCEASVWQEATSGVYSPEVPLKAYARWVADTGRELFIRTKRRKDDNALFSQGKQPIMAIPLVWRTTNTDADASVFGAVVISGSSGKDFGPQAIDIARIMTSMSSGAIVNLLLYHNLQKSFTRTLEGLVNDLEGRDEQTVGHSKRVAEVSCLLADQLGVSQEAKDLLETASRLHDIGMIGVSEDLMDRAGRLTVEESEVMRHHPVSSEQICRSLRLSEDVLFLIKHHHEHLDGKGYPDSLPAQEQPLLQRILAVADWFDEMCCLSGSATPLSEPAVRSELNKAAGRTMDPTVVDTLLQLADSGRLDTIYEDYCKSVSLNVEEPPQVYLRVA